MSDGFLSRWSRRKQDAAVGRALDEPAPTAVAPLLPQGLPGPTSVAVPGAQAAHNAPDEPDAPLPSLEDTKALGPTSDFQPFMRRGVTPDVRNAAMKKLFADPHFNAMDGLDIYIGDYTQPDPLPAGMLAQMVGAQFLNLVPPQAPEETSAHKNAEENPDQNPQAQQGDAVVAQSPDSVAPLATTITDHDHTDLQLQPDSAAADPQAGSGPR